MQYKLKDGRILEIEQDKVGGNSREWDNLATMVCLHKGYFLGDKHDYKTGDFLGWGELKQQIEKDYKVVTIAPLYLYDHSGLRIKIGSFDGLLSQGHAKFDSGQVGFIFVTEDSIKKRFEVTEITPEIKQRAEETMRSEVETYDKELIGDVWAYMLYEVEKCDKGEEHKKVIDSCGGFYGTDFKENGLFEHAGIKEEDIVKEGKP